MSEPKQVFKIPYNILEFARERGRINILADFLYLKRLYSNSCIFNYNTYSLSKKSGFSRTKIARLIPLFLKFKWCKIHCGNLIFLKMQGSQFTWIKCKNETKEIRLLLNLELLKNKRSQCMMAYKVKCDLKNPKNLRDYKKALKLGRLVRLEGASNKNFVISSERLSWFFKCSKSKVLGILKLLKERGLVIIDTWVEKFRCAPILFNSIKDTLGFHYYKNGFACKQQPLTILIQVQPSDK